MNSQVAQNYSEALFNIALKKKLLKEYKEKLNAILKIYNESDDLRYILNSPNVKKEDKKSIVDKVFNDEKNLKSFLKLLIDDNKFKEIESIVKNFNVLVNKQLNIKTAKIISAKTLNDLQIKQVEEVIKKRCNSDVEFTFHVDNSLIAGLKVILENEIIDNSLYKNFSNLKNSLIER